MNIRSFFFTSHFHASCSLKRKGVFGFLECPYIYYIVAYTISLPPEGILATLSILYCVVWV